MEVGFSRARTRHLSYKSAKLLSLIILCCSLRAVAEGSFYASDQSIFSFDFVGETVEIATRRSNTHIIEVHNQTAFHLKYEGPTLGPNPLQILALESVSIPCDPDMPIGSVLLYLRSDGGHFEDSVSQAVECGDVIRLRTRADVLQLREEEQ